VTSGGGWVRNGDRWQVTELPAHGVLGVEDLSGRGRLVLPAAHVSVDVDLASAVTVHKAQGLTVDRAVLVVDERTTAESLYVAMTRGRCNKTALVVTEVARHDHWRGGLGEPMAVLRAALARSGAERSAPRCCGTRRPPRSPWPS